MEKMLLYRQFARYLDDTTIEHTTISQIQCDQMATPFVQYLAFYNNESWPNWIHYFQK